VTALLRILIVIPFGYIAACMSAGIFGVLSVYDLSGGPDFSMAGFAISGGIVAGMYFGAFAFVPALCLIILAEASSWRSFFLYAPAGGAIALGTALFIHEAITDLTVKASVVAAAAGLVGGAVYWLIAGRGAGGGFSSTKTPATRG
jgi:hypothetical protein